MSNTRIILFTGKGGVGKTTLSAATALRAAELGHRTLVMSTDPAHSLADAFDVELGPEPVEMQPNLFGQEIDVLYSLKKYWANLRELMFTLFKWRGLDRTLAEEMAILPGFEEVSAFLWLEMFYRSGDYELIVIDSAPTGETLKHLTLPQVSQWWLTRAVPVQRLADSTLGAVASRVTGVPLDKGLKELESFYTKLNSIQEIMSDPKISTIRLVLNPERMVIQEALRAYTYLQLYGYPVDAVLVNRVLPPESADTMFKAYHTSQQGYLQQIEQSFAPLPIFQVSHLGREVFGRETLREIAAGLYGERDPRDRFFNQKPYQFIEQAHGFLLKIHLPFVPSETVKVSQNGDELIIEAGSRRRNMFLPKFLSDYRMTNSQMFEGKLLVRFEKKGR